jgi:hypothetical protein
LDRELLLAGIPVAHEFFRAGVEILLADANALSKCRWGWLVQDLHAAPCAAGDLNAIESRARFRGTKADAPHLSWRQRIALNRLLPAFGASQ